MSSEITYQYLLEEKSESLYDEANLLASTYSNIYQGKNISLSTANPQLQAVATYLKAQAWVINQKGSVVAETVPASHIGTAIDGFDPTVAGNRSYMTGSFFGMFDKAVRHCADHGQLQYVWLRGDPYAHRTDRTWERPDPEHCIHYSAGGFHPVPDHSSRVHKDCICPVKEDHCGREGIRGGKFKPYDQGNFCR